MNAIETQGLTKSFHGLYAVKDLSLHVPQGSIYGFIGENGSGKSTTEKLICGLLVRSSGTIDIMGQPNSNPVIRSRLGALIENPGCFPNSTVYQNLFMQCLNLGVNDPEEKIAEVLHLVSMEGAARRKFRECSLGTKQRIGIAQSLLGDPKILILDEPINGLDADGMRIFRETILRLNRDKGVTVLISSHILGELEKIATHYGIIWHGQMIKEIGAADLQKECRSFVTVKTNDNERAAISLKAYYPSLEIKDGEIRIYEENATEAIAASLCQNGYGIRELRMQRIGLEEYYLQVMQAQEGNQA
jgi:ABC-type multidrug transport system ATPase subunit